ncbi:MAG: hypothetical protein ABSD21_08120 [Rhizomicrobium sp.]|jgi:hypothetical protein
MTAIQMTRDPAWLLEHRSNFLSQTGEDGVIAKILEVLPEQNCWCVEFGAWDGRHMSNTANLVLNKNYAAVLIEADADKLKELKSNYADNEKIIALNRFVGFDESDNLDVILKETPIPRDFDFLSIDIDGNDYHVWSAMSLYVPKLVCVEYNPTIPTEVHFVQEKNRDVKQGNSLAAYVALGKEKGYELICATELNAFFVRQEYFPLFEISDNSAGTLRRNTELVTYIFSGFDGAVLLTGSRELPWHQLKLDSEKFQVLPRWLRRFPADYSRMQARAFQVLRRVRGW